MTAAARVPASIQDSKQAPLPTPEGLAALRREVEATLGQLPALQAKLPPAAAAGAGRLTAARDDLERSLQKIDEAAALLAGTKAPPKEPAAPAGTTARPSARQSTMAATPVMPGGLLDVGNLGRAEMEELFARAVPADPRYDPAWAAAQHDQAQAQLLQQSRPRPDASATTHPRQGGRFTIGNPGGPGRPRKPRLVERDAMTIMINAVGEERLARLAVSAAERAIEGDNVAGRLLYQMLFKNSRATLTDAAAAAASGLSDDEHRVLMARDRYGKAMDEAAAARAEFEALQADETPEVDEPIMPPADAAELVTPEADSLEETLEAPVGMESDMESGAEAAPNAAATPQLDVVEVRLAPRQAPWDAEPSGASHPRPDKNAQKRLKTAINGQNGRATSAVA